MKTNRTSQGNTYTYERNSVFPYNGLIYGYFFNDSLFGIICSPKFAFLIENGELTPQLIDTLANSLLKDEDNFNLTCVLDNIPNELNNTNISFNSSYIESNGIHLFYIFQEDERNLLKAIQTNPFISK